MKHTDPPPTPNYAGAATAQGAANTQAGQATAQLSNPNIISPYGNQTVTFEGNQPTVTQTLPQVPQNTLERQQITENILANTGQSQASNISQILNTPFGFGGTPQLSLGNYGTPQDAANPGAYQLGGGPSANQYGLASGGPQSPQLQSRYDESGVAKAPINGGTTAQQAIMARLQPSLDRQRTSTETQLVNQGLRPGGQAYDNAINDLGQQENDARQQAVLAGLGLDMSANQQGFGQAQARGDFANQSALQGYGAGVTGAQLGNQAIGQNFGQGQSAQAAQNTATQGNYGNQLNYQQAQNSAQQQGFNQALQSGQFGNTALNQQLAQLLQVRDQPLNEISGLMSGSQIQNPQFQQYQGANVGAAPVFQGAQAQDQFNQNRYAQQVAQNNALIQGLFGLGGSAMKFL